MSPVVTPDPPQDDDGDAEAVFDSMMAAVGDDTDQTGDLVRAAASIRNRLILGGWSTNGAEDLTSTIIAHALNVNATERFMAADDDDD